MMNHHRNSARRQAGISLIEALIALAIMAIGMLGIVGVQSTLRSTSDVAKQRGEATRLAQMEIERWRAFLTLSGGTGTNYNSLPPGTFTDPPIVGVNATYTRSRTVSVLPTPRFGKSVSVQVTWDDRSGQTQSVQLSTLIAGISPELTMTMVVPGGGDVLQQTNGRKGGIPLGAKELGGGNSGWIPPGSPTGTAWVFNNITGVITLCTTTATTTTDLIYDLVSPTGNNVTCGTLQAVYIGGYVRYALGAPQPTAVEATNPPSLPIDLPAGNAVTVGVVYAFGTGTLSTASYVKHVNAVNVSLPSYTEYHCAVPVLVVPGLPPSWIGTLWFGPVGYISASIADDDASRMRVCRYHTAASYGPQSTPLANQNFLMIRGGSAIPPAAGAPYICPTPPTQLQQPLI